VRSFRRGDFARFWTVIVCAAVIATGVACGVLAPPAPGTRPVLVLPGQASGVFTPAHSSFGSAVNDFFAVKPKVAQPIEFPHKVHVEQGIKCAETCHESVTKGPVAGLPGLNTCMGCHSSIATDKPLIQQITAMQEKGIDLSWQRVYGYTSQAHVRFNHAPHIRANVECSTCHGDIAHQTVAERTVDIDMGFCVTCHREKNAPNECLTCHF
jgi:Cytochrome c7 and related cytochrome c